MKQCLFWVFLFLTLPAPVLANGAGLPAFFSLNGKLAITNPLQAYGITASSFLLPQDFAPENYVVNQPITMEVDLSQLQSVIDPQYFKNTEFSWDFGDGTQATGLKNSHTYTKIGSYILLLTINIRSGYGGEPTQFLDSFLVHILPSGDFTDLPQAVITVNSVPVRDPLKQSVDANLDGMVSFDASASKAPGSSIVEYLWNFGDGQSGSKSSLTHTFSGQNNATVVLHIKDTNGFTSDAFVSLKNVAHAADTIHPQPRNYRVYGLVLLSIAGLIAGVFWFRKKGTNAR